MTKTILEEAKEILYERKQEKERQYGPFEESMEKAAACASVIAGHELSSNDIYAALIGVKLARQGFAHKRDNILDAIVYLAQMNDENENPDPNKWAFKLTEEQHREFLEQLKKSHSEQLYGYPFTVDFSTKSDFDKAKDDLMKADPGRDPIPPESTRKPYEKHATPPTFSTTNNDKVPTTAKNNRKKTSINSRRKTRKATKK